MKRGERWLSLAIFFLFCKKFQGEVWFVRIIPPPVWNYLFPDSPIFMYTQAPLILFTLYDCGYRIPLLFDSWISIICERVIRLFSGPVRTYIFSATFISTSFYHMSHKKAILIFRIFCNFKGLLAKNGPNQGKYRLFWSDLWSKFSENPEGFSVWLQCEKER